MKESLSEALYEELTKLGWRLPRIMLIAHIVLAIIQKRTVNLSTLATSFDHTALTESNYKRLQRFLRDNSWNIADIRALWTRWLPKEPWILCLDRTNWKLGKNNINILVLAVEWKGLAIPILWKLLPKKGNSNLQERISLLQEFVERYGIEKIQYITADREFRGILWIQWLLLLDIHFRIRIPNNTKVRNRHGNSWLPVTRLFGIQVGEVMTLNKMRKIWGIPVWISATRSADEYVIVISDERVSTILEDYRRRWSIETLFSALKIRGFNLEDTHITSADRVSRLFALLTLTFVWCYRAGIWLNECATIQKKKHGYRAKSLFRKGLDWLQRICASKHAREKCLDIALQLLPMHIGNPPISKNYVL